MKLCDKNMRDVDIYKNLLRDCRRFYANDFDDVTNYYKNKKELPRQMQNVSQFEESLKMYIKARMNQERKALNIKMKDLVLTLGGLMNPKEMIKLLGKDNVAILKVFQIYNQLYQFSFDRLSTFMNSNANMLLMLIYLKLNSFRRVHDSVNMCRYLEAYREAFKNIIMLSKNIHAFVCIFDVRELLRDS